jgi:hypothetical protein
MKETIKIEEFSECDDNEECGTTYQLIDYEDYVELTLIICNIDKRNGDMLFF